MLRQLTKEELEERKQILKGHTTGMVLHYDDSCEPYRQMFQECRKVNNIMSAQCQEKLNLFDNCIQRLQNEAMRPG